MSYDDYGDGSRRPSRRREPAGPAKIQGSTAAAILVFVAIVGFGIGALIGNSSGDDPSTTATEDRTGATSGSPDDQSDTPRDTEGEDGSDDSSDNDDGSEDTGENDDQQGAVGEGITASSQQDGGEVAADDSGRIEVQATLDSGEEGVTLRPQRSLDGGQTWEDFCDDCIEDTSGNGTYSTSFWSGRGGENMFRIVTVDGEDGLASNPITVNVVDSEGEDSE